MVKVTFVEPSGVVHDVEAEEGLSLMQAAVHNSVPGILAECGGSCSCATCHVYVAQDWREKVGPPGDIEKSLIEFTPEPRPGSRLSCQIRVTAEFEGLCVELPKTQE